MRLNPKHMRIYVGSWRQKGERYTYKLVKMRERKSGHLGNIKCIKSANFLERLLSLKIIES